MSPLPSLPICTMTNSRGWGRAVEIDHALRQEAMMGDRKLTQNLYLHRSCLALDVVGLEHEKTLFRPITNECQGICGV